MGLLETAPVAPARYPVATARYPVATASQTVEIFLVTSTAWQQVATLRR